MGICAQVAAASLVAVSATWSQTPWDYGENSAGACISSSLRETQHPWAKLVEDLGCAASHPAEECHSRSASPPQRAAKHPLVMTAKAELGKEAATQHFSCDAALVWKRCLQELAILKRAVEGYPTTTLGEWTWVLVRSQDWKRLTRARGLDPDSPSFTFLGRRQTYVEEALVVPVPGRERELVDRWHMPSDFLLAFAITHEMGHGICGTASEAQANRVAALLRARIPAWC